MSTCSWYHTDRLLVSCIMPFPCLKMGGLYYVKSFELPCLCLEKRVKDLHISSLLPHPISCRRSVLTWIWKSLPHHESGQWAVEPELRTECWFWLEAHPSHQADFFLWLWSKGARDAKFWIHSLISNREQIFNLLVNKSHCELKTKTQGCLCKETVLTIEHGTVTWILT